MAAHLTLLFSNAKYSSYSTLEVEMRVVNECEWEAWVGNEDLL